MTNILIVGAAGWPTLLGGAERSQGELAESLAARPATQVRLLTLAPRGGYQVVDGTRLQRVDHLRLAPVWKGFGHVRPPSRLGFGRAWWHALELAGWSGLDRSSRRLLRSSIDWADLVVTNSVSGWSSRLWPRVRRSGVPVVHIVRDHYVSCARVTRFRDGTACDAPCWSCRPFAEVHRRRSAHVSHVIHISEFMRSLHEREGYFSSASVRVAANRPTLVPREHEPVDESGVLRVGFIGAGTVEKGLALLLAAIDRPEFAGRVRVVTAGDNGVGSAVEHIDAVELGVVPAALLLSMIDLLAVPSLWWEPQGRVVAEAGLADIPVLTTGHGGLGEGIGRDASGWVVPATATAWHEFFEGYLAEGGNPLPMVERAGTSSSATQAEVIASLLEAKGDRTVA